MRQAPLGLASALGPIASSYQLPLHVVVARRDKAMPAADSLVTPAGDGKAAARRNTCGRSRSETSSLLAPFFLC
jgi:hypothetical protein